MIYICTYISSFYLSVILPHVPSILLYVVLNYTVLYFSILNYTIRYYTIRYSTKLYYTKLYYTILYYTILYYTEIYFYGSSGFFYFILYILSSIFHCSFQIHQSNLLISSFITLSIFILFSPFSVFLDCPQLDRKSSDK